MNIYEYLQPVFLILFCHKYDQRKYDRENSNRDDRNQLSYFYSANSIHLFLSQTPRIDVTKENTKETTSTNSINILCKK